MHCRFGADANSFSLCYSDSDSSEDLDFHGRPVTARSKAEGESEAELELGVLRAPFGREFVPARLVKGAMMVALPTHISLIRNRLRVSKHDELERSLLEEELAAYQNNTHIDQASTKVSACNEFAQRIAFIK